MGATVAARMDPDRRRLRQAETVQPAHSSPDRSQEADREGRRFFPFLGKCFCRENYISKLKMPEALFMAYFWGSERNEKFDILFPGFTVGIPVYFLCKGISLLKVMP